MPQESTYINRLDTEKDIDFENIRKEGIRLLQELSGRIWTDYNLHDPGVTILEQLIYALTELVYFTGFDVKDFITSADGEIKYHDLALYKPLEIFPSENITSNDYCKTIFDTIEGVRNLWAINSDKPLPKGLHVFLIDLAHDQKKQEAEIRENIKKYFHAHRNLCEDLNDIQFITREPIELGATIEINGNRTPEEIMADIFFAGFKAISPRITLHSYHQLSATDATLDEILSGPELSHGFIKDEEIPPLIEEFFVSELMKEIFLIDGVESIVDFYMEKNGQKIRTKIDFPKPEIAGYIKFPEHAGDLKINLLRNDRLCSINIPEMLRMLYSEYYKYKSIYNTSQDLADLSKPPQGQYVNFGNYYSLQNQFPAIYGINQFGVPFSAPPEQKAKVKQLKAYLLLFEQILANGLTQMENIKELFSVNQHEKVSYYTKALTDIPDIREVLDGNWKDDPKKHQKELQQILSRFDNYYERKNRFLDFILSMYGEKFSYNTFQQFNYYYPAEELPRIICENKIFMLKNLLKINRYKARSFNYCEPSWNTENVSMIKMKISLLLGITDFRQISYSDVLANYHLRFLDKTENGKCSECVFDYKDFNIDLDSDFIEEEFTNVPTDKKQKENYTLIDITKEIVYLKDGLISEDFFRYGINPDCYKIGKLKHRHEYTVVFKHPKNKTYIYISDFNERKAAIKAINRLRRLLVKLNKDSEGMHIVEHILLRQKTEGYVSEYQIVINNEKVVFLSTPDFVLDEEDSANQLLAEILTERENYSSEAVAEGGYHIVLLKEHKKVLRGTQVFSSADEALLNIEIYCNLFQVLTNQGLINQQIRAPKKNEVPENFFPLRISVILPTWSARFNNERFRDYVEETFRLNLPAHIYPEYYWLDIPTLNQFERLYHNWLNVKLTGDTVRTDEYAGRLIRFLIEHRPVKYKEDARCPQNK